MKSKLRMHFIAILFKVIHFEATGFIVEEDVEDVAKLLEGVMLISLYNRAKENNLKTKL